MGVAGRFGREFHGGSGLYAGLYETSWSPSLWASGEFRIVFGGFVGYKRARTFGFGAWG